MGKSLAFRNIRYAQAERFGSAELLPFSGADADRARGPIPPQNPSRFDVILGPPAPLPQSEDCQVLSVFTPATTGRRPVMVWLHGGAFITGGGELPWYDGASLAAEHDVVVVSVTARLGALGYLFPDGGGDGDRPSPAMTDQVTAIEWVHRNIDQFGGDPDDITLFGQSAGGFSIEVMLRWGLGPHVKAAIIQSGFIKQPGLTHDSDSVTRQAAEFTAVLGQDPRSASVAELLAAQLEFARQAGTVEIWGPMRPPVEKPIEVPVLAGWTQHDTLPYVLMENGIFAPVADQFDVYGDEVRLRNDEQIARGTYEALDDAVAHGQPAWLYEFDGEAPASGWGSPHCIELPFLLGDPDAWSAAPMLAGADWDVLDQQRRALRSRWVAFARDRNPGGDWIGYDPATKPVNRVPSGPPGAAGPAGDTAGRNQALSGAETGISSGAAPDEGCFRTASSGGQQHG